MTAPAAHPVRLRQRAVLLWGGLAWTLALTLWTALRSDEADTPIEAQAPRPQRAHPSGPLPGSVAPVAPPTAATLPPTRTAWAALMPAGRSAWTPPPSPAPRVAAAAAPPRPLAEAPAPAQAPPPPFTLIGRYQDSRGAAALLATPQRTLVVREGELADPQWRVDAVATQRIELTWLPGAQKRSLAYPPGT